MYEKLISYCDANRLMSRRAESMHTEAQGERAEEVVCALEPNACHEGDSVEDADPQAVSTQVAQGSHAASAVGHDRKTTVRSDIGVHTGSASCLSG